LFGDSLRDLRIAYKIALNSLIKDNFKINKNKSHKPRNFTIHLGWMIKHNLKFLDKVKFEKFLKLKKGSASWLGLASYFSLSCTEALSLTSAAQKLLAKKIPIPNKLLNDIENYILKFKDKGVSSHPAKRIKCFVDASPTHIGMVIHVDKKTYNITLKHNKPNQFLAEYHALTTAYNHIKSNYIAANVKIWSDNKPAIRIARNYGINALFIKGSENPADAPSRPTFESQRESAISQMLHTAKTRLNLADQQLTGRVIGDLYGN
jgi:hypothetical protein